MLHAQLYTVLYTVLYTAHKNFQKCHFLWKSFVCCRSSISAISWVISMHKVSHKGHGFGNKMHITILGYFHKADKTLKNAVIRFVPSVYVYLYHFPDERPVGVIDFLIDCSF